MTPEYHSNATRRILGTPPTSWVFALSLCVLRIDIRSPFQRTSNHNHNKTSKGLQRSIPWALVRRFGWCPRDEGNLWTPFKCAYTSMSLVTSSLACLLFKFCHKRHHKSAKVVLCGFIGAFWEMASSCLFHTDAPGVSGRVPGASCRGP